MARHCRSCPVSSRSFFALFILSAAVVISSSQLTAAQATGFPNTTVGASSPQAITLTMSTAGSLASTKVVTQGAANKDFQFATGGTCTIGNAFSVGDTCTVKVKFGPLAPGIRTGAVILLDGSGNVLAESYMFGTGQGAAVALLPGLITTVAGGAGAGSSGDGGAATSAQLNSSRGAAVDAAGNLYIADTQNNVVRRVDAVTQVITTVAGNSAAGPGFSGNGGPATKAQLFAPTTASLDGAGNLYIADFGNNVIRRVDAVTGVITTAAGNNAAGFSGDNGPATKAQLNQPWGVSVDGAGNLYIADTANNVIRMVDGTTHKITTVAGSNAAGFSGDNDLATKAQLDQPGGVAVDGAGNLYIADTNNNVIRKVDGTTHKITTVAGNNAAGFGYSGDNGPATSAQFHVPRVVALDPAGNLYIADVLNEVIRKVDAATQTITTVAGNNSLGGGYTGDKGPATSAQLANPSGVALDSNGDMYIADRDNNAIRRVSASAAPLSFPNTNHNSPSTDLTVTASNTGNLALNIKNVAPTTVNFAVTNATSTCVMSPIVAAGDTCVANVHFVPQAVGLLKDNLVFTDDVLNVTGSQQMVAMSGTGKQTQTIAFPNPGTQSYGATLTLMATATSGLPVTYTVISGPATVSGSALTVTGVGSVTVQADQAGNVNWSPAPPVHVTFSAIKASPKFSGLTAPSITYGKGSVTVTGTVSVGMTVFPPKGETVTIGINGTSVTAAATTSNGKGFFSAVLDTHAIPVGSYGVTYSYVGDANFNSVKDTSTQLTIVRAALTITANADSKTYGQTQTYGAGSTAFTSSGLQNGETIGSVTLTVNKGGAATDPVGSYSITPSAATGGTFTASNYAITYMTGTLTVGAATLTVTANNDSKTYGQVKPYGPGSTAFTSSGLQNGETIGSVTLSSPGQGGTAAASNYPITPSAATGGTFTASNYAITYMTGTLTVSAAALTVTANNDNKTYGQVKLYGPGSTAFRSSGLQNGETIGSVTLSSPGQGGTAAVGSYPITPSAATGGTFSANNYTITYNNGALTVGAALLTVTANADSKTYGQTKTYGAGSTAFTSSGLQNGETISSVTLTVPKGGAATDPVGSYPITPSAVTGGTFNANNYTITYNNGTLTVSVAALTITANNNSKTYGQTQTYGAGSTAFTSSGLQNGETIGSVTLTVPKGGAATDPAGSYSITPSAATGGTFTASNYAITYMTGTLTVGAATLTVTANNDSKTYGQVKPYGPGSTAFTSSGLQNGETIGSVTLSSLGQGGTAVVGSYSIVPIAATGGTFNPNNYTITYNNGTLTVTVAMPMFTNLASSVSVPYGTDSITVSGTISAGTVYPPTTNSVTINISTSPATSISTQVQANGVFSTTFPIGTIPVSSTPYTITYDYNSSGSNTNFGSATDSSKSLTVNPDNSAVTLKSLTNPSYVNNSVTFNATVTGVTSKNVPTGKVTFTNNGSPIADCPSAVALSGGLAHCTTTSLTAATTTIKAAYSGDTNFNGSNGTLQQTVNQTGTNTQLLLAPSTSVSTTPVLLTATVGAASPGTYSPTGTVTFTSNGTNIPNTSACPNPGQLSLVNSVLTATCTTISLASGVDAVQATYNGDTNFSSSAAAGQQTVQDFTIVPAPLSVVTVAQNYNNTNSPLLQFQQAMAVTLAQANGLPFPDTASLSCSVSPSATNAPVCSLSQSSLVPPAAPGIPVVVTISSGSATPIGTYQVTVTAQDSAGPTHYAYYTVNVIATSTTVNVVSGTPGTTTANFAGPSGVTVTNFRCASVTGTDIPPAGADPSNIGMNCTAFNPASMTLTGANTPSPPVTVTVTTQAGSTTTGMIRRTPGIFASLWFAVPAILLIGPRRYGKFSKAKVLQALGLSLVLLLLLYASGCGGGFTPVKATGATPPGTYNLLVQGTGSDGATYSAIVPVNVPR